MIKSEDLLSRAGLLSFPVEGKTNWGINMRICNLVIETSCKVWGTYLYLHVLQLKSCLVTSMTIFGRESKLFVLIPNVLLLILQLVPLLSILLPVGPELSHMWDQLQSQVNSNSHMSYFGGDGYVEQTDPGLQSKC